MSLVISNASPLIGLCRIKRLHLLKDLWREITVKESKLKFRRKRPGDDVTYSQKTKNPDH